MADESDAVCLTALHSALAYRHTAIGGSWAFIVTRWRPGFGGIAASESRGESLTAIEFIRLLCRRWPVVTLGAVLTVLGGYLLAHRGPLYYCHTQVMVLPPVEQHTVNVLTRGSYSLTELAAVLVTDYNHGKRPLQMNSSDATLYGEEVRSGTVVHLHNSGGQWVSIYDQPVIEVEVVDPDPMNVRTETAAVNTTLARILDRRQQALGIEQTSQVSLRESPSVPVVAKVRGARSRTLGAALLVGIWITMVASYVTDRVSSRRKPGRTWRKELFRSPVRPLSRGGSGE